MSFIKPGAMCNIRKRTLRMLGAALLILPTMSFAAEDLLLNEDSLAAKIGKEPNCQLLDGRSPEARRSAPLAFSMRYQKNMAIKKGLVFVVADSDEAALEIARSIAADAERSVYAVK